MTVAEFIRDMAKPVGVSPETVFINTPEATKGQIVTVNDVDWEVVWVAPMKHGGVKVMMVNLDTVPYR